VYWCILQNNGAFHEEELVSWSLTSLFSTDMAISETNHDQEMIGLGSMTVRCSSGDSLKEAWRRLETGTCETRLAPLGVT